MHPIDGKNVYSKCCINVFCDINLSTVHFFSIKNSKNVSFSGNALGFAIKTISHSIISTTQVDNAEYVTVALPFFPIHCHAAWCCVDSSPTGLHKLHCLFLWHLFSLLKTQSLTKTQPSHESSCCYRCDGSTPSESSLRCVWHEPRSHSRDPWTHNGVGLDDQITVGKKHIHTHTRALLGEFAIPPMDMALLVPC